MEKLLYEYAVVRYVPYIEREEFLNIGLLMLCKRQKWIKGEIKIDTQRLMAFDPDANQPLLALQSSLFEKTDNPSALLPVEERYRWLTAAKSAILQTSASHPGIIYYNDGEDPSIILAKEFERLFSRLIKI